MLILSLCLALAVAGLLVVPVVLRVKGPTAKDPARKAWLTFLRRLEEAGFPASLSDGPSELAIAASARFSSDASSIDRIALLYTRCRYAPGRPPVQDLKQAVGRFKPKKTAR